MTTCIKTKYKMLVAADPGTSCKKLWARRGVLFFNNIAIAAKYLQNVLKYKRILIVDWDYHHGDGTEFFSMMILPLLFFLCMIGMRILAPEIRREKGRVKGSATILMSI